MNAMRKRAGPRGPSRPRHETREQAKHLLIHRANGGLHNAAIALKLVTASPPLPAAEGRDEAAFVAAGVRGTTSAARALHMLGALIGLEPATAQQDAAAFVDDITTLLRAKSRRRGITLRMELSERRAPSSAIPVDALVEILVSGLSAVEDAAPNSCLTIRTRAASSPSEKPLAVEIEVTPGEALRPEVRDSAARGAS